MANNHEFRIKNRLLNCWNILKREINWKKLTKDNYDPKEYEKLHDLSLKLANEFIKKFKDTPYLEVNPALIDNFQSVKIKSDYSNICLLIPYDFTQLYKLEIADKYNIEHILSRNTKIDDLIYDLKESKDIIRKPLRKKDVEIIKAFASHPYPYQNQIHLPLRKISRRGHT